MEIRDDRTDGFSRPLCESHVRMLGAVVGPSVAFETGEPQRMQVNVHIMDTDKANVLMVPHLRVNFEPRFINAKGFGFAWHRFSKGVHLKSRQLLNTDRPTWAIWEE